MSAGRGVPRQQHHMVADGTHSVQPRAGKKSSTETPNDLGLFDLRDGFVIVTKQQHVNHTQVFFCHRIPKQASYTNSLEHWQSCNAV